MGRHSASKTPKAAKQPRGGPQGRFSSTRQVIDYADYPPIRTSAAVRAWIAAGKPKVRDSSRVQARTTRQGYEAVFGTQFPWPATKGKSRRAR